MAAQLLFCRLQEQETMRLAQFEQAGDFDDVASLVADRRKSMVMDEMRRQSVMEGAVRSGRHPDARGSKLDAILNRCSYAPSTDDLRRMSFVNRCGRAVCGATLRN
jgi:hypothetical protein